MKIQKALKLNVEVYEDINHRTNEEGFNFSDWVEVTYTKQFLTEKSLKTQLEFHQKQVKKMENKLEYLVKKRKNYLKNLKKCDSIVFKRNTEFSKKVLSEHPEKVDARLRSFNTECNTNLTKSEFIELLGL